uniref:Uncharacterized protein n=1 Tax=Arundo donax TaxID=35708 RepID=A0A0A9BHN3_ARUDO
MAPKTLRAQVKLNIVLGETKIANKMGMNIVNMETDYSMHK